MITTAAEDVDREITDADPKLYNHDLAPVKEQTWKAYNIFAFWMSDVHTVGGYVFAGSLFALGLTSWQVLLCLLIGIGIVNLFCNLIAKPSQVAGVPYPVVCRATFGVRGANIPAMIRGFIAVAWYGVQTFLASSALVIVAGLFFVRDGARSQLAGQLFLVCWCRRRRPVLPNVDSASAVCGVHRHGDARLAGLGRRDLRPVGMSSGSSATVCNMASESSAAQDVPFCFTSARRAFGEDRGVEWWNVGVVECWAWRREALRRCKFGSRP